jgi:hypothetical protein
MRVPKLSPLTDFACVLVLVASALALLAFILLLPLRENSEAVLIFGSSGPV